MELSVQTDGNDAFSFTHRWDPIRMGSKWTDPSMNEIRLIRPNGRDIRVCIRFSITKIYPSYADGTHRIDAPGNETQINPSIHGRDSRTKGADAVKLDQSVRARTGFLWLLGILGLCKIYPSAHGRDT